MKGIWARLRSLKRKTARMRCWGSFIGLGRPSEGWIIIRDSLRNSTRMVSFNTCLKVVREGRLDLKGKFVAVIKIGAHKKATKCKASSAQVTFLGFCRKRKQANIENCSQLLRWRRLKDAIRKHRVFHFSDRLRCAKPEAGTAKNYWNKHQARTQYSGRKILYKYLASRGWFWTAPSLLKVQHPIQGPRLNIFGPSSIWPHLKY